MVLGSGVNLSELEARTQDRLDHDCQRDLSPLPAKVTLGPHLPVILKKLVNPIGNAKYEILVGNSLFLTRMALYPLAKTPVDERTLLCQVYPSTLGPDHQEYLTNGFHLSILCVSSGSS